MTPASFFICAWLWYLGDLQVASTYLPQLFLFALGVLAAQMCGEAWNNRDSLRVRGHEAFTCLFVLLLFGGIRSDTNCTEC